MTNVFEIFINKPEVKFLAPRARLALYIVRVIKIIFFPVVCTDKKIDFSCSDAPNSDLKQKNIHVFYKFLVFLETQKIFLLFFTCKVHFL